MKNSPFFYFLALYFKSKLKNHIDIIILSSILISLLSGVMITSSTYRNYINSELLFKSDIVLQNRVGGNIANMPEEWIDKILEIRGVSKVTPRVYKREGNFTILGVDFLEDIADKNIERVLKDKDINLKEIISENIVIVGSNIPIKSGEIELNLKSKKIKLKAINPPEKFKKYFPKNLILAPIDLVKDILKIEDNYISDIALSVPNGDEWDNILLKLDSLFFSSFSIDKREIEKNYSKMFSFKEGFFLILYLTILMIFSLILYHRYSNFYKSDSRDINILKAIGWSINSIILLIFAESFIIVFLSLVLGFTGGLILFYFGKYPFFGDIFLSEKDLVQIGRPDLYLDFSTIASIFFIYTIPFIASILIPVWKIAVTDPKESL